MSLGKEAVSATDLFARISTNAAEIIFSGLKWEVGAVTGFGPGGG